MFNVLRASWIIHMHNIFFYYFIGLQKDQQYNKGKETEDQKDLRCPLCCVTLWVSVDNSFKTPGIHCESVCISI